MNLTLQHLFAIFALEMALDGWTTWHVLRFGGREVIPYLKWLMEKVGTYNALLIAKIVPIAFVGRAIYVNEMSFDIMMWLCVGYAIVVYWNWKQLQKHKEL